MSTTIDRLEVEITSNSGSAASGIDALAASLGKLKQNGTISVAVKNLNNLTAALKGMSSVASNASKISSLADAMAKLKLVGSSGSGVKKLSESLQSLKNVDYSALSRAAEATPLFERLAASLGTLSGVKAGGISTMVNSLARIGDVTAKLDDDTINRFAERVGKLSEKLGPLSEKMATIQAGFRGINAQAKAAESGMKSFENTVDATTLNLSSLISVVQGALAALQPVIRLFDKTISDAIEWDGIAARFGRGFGDSADETYKWIQRLNKEMGINVQQFMQYSSVYATMLTGFGVATKDATQMALGYTELTYDIWAGYNDIYKNFADAAEAVKSAIAGEVEPIRRAGFTIVEATLEQTAANHGLSISLENATEAQKSYLRYLTLVDQAHSQDLVGTYAKELNTAEGLTRTLAQQVKTLSQTFGSVFLPILVKIMPWLSAFVELIGEAIIAAANFFGIDIQKANFGNSGIKDIEKDAEGANQEIQKTEQAIKDLKNATLGIDELNVISPSSGSASSGSDSADSGFGGLDVDSLWDQSIFDGIQNQVGEIKEKIKSWLPVVGAVTAAFAGWRLLDFLTDLDNVIKKIDAMNPKIKGIGKQISIAAITVAVGALVWDFTDAYIEGGDEADLLKAIGTTALGAGLAAFLAGKPGAAIVLTTSGIITLTRLAIGIKNGEVEWSDPEAILTGLTGLVETAIGGVLTWKVIGPKVTKAFKNIAARIGPWVTGTVIPALSAAAPYIAIAGAVVGGVVLAFVDYDFTEVGRTVGEKVGEALRTVGGWIKNVGEAIWDGLKAALDWLKDSLDIDDFWDVLAILFVPGELKKRIEPELSELFANIEEWFDEKIENLKGNINEFFGGFFDGLFDGLGWDVSWAEKFVEVFDIDYLDVVEAVNKIIRPNSIGRDIIGGIIEGLKSGNLFSSVKEKFTDFVGKVKEFFGIKSPSTLMRDQIGKNLISGIVSGMGTNGIKDKLSSMWSTAKTWWDKSKSALSAYTPSIGSISSKLSSAWTTAKSWWDKSKSGLASYTPSIGSIKDRLVSAWNTAKSWWNKNVKLSIPSLSFKVTYTTKGLNGIQKAIVNALGLSGWPKLSFAKDGGIFDTGSLIWAGEAGAEIVANAGGGKTGVMNVEQMQNAVYEGVYAAVTAAMRANSGNGGSQSVNVYLDSRQITSSVEQRQRERGASILGKQVYA